MDAALERRALDLIDEVLDAEPHLQAERLTEAVTAHPELANLLNRLFHADRAARPALPTEHAAAPEPASPPPERIGPYRLTERLGAGGMGEVWRGERDDGLFQQSVAIKLIRQGVMGAAAAERFAVERGLLARLTHPNISRLYDGGTDPEGRPYFVMELLGGIPISRHAADRALSLREASALLLPVCAAVQHAHQASIVHADIKPGNVLVEADGTMKLLDFGIARFLEDAPDEAPLALTPAYASPARRAGEPPTPADDVYALGALLYELAVGRPPEGEPPIGRPSTALAARGDPRAPQAAGDLDAIVGKACALDPAERYQSAEALADDLQRWLQRRPVRARPLGRLGIAGRFLRRHPLATAAGTVAVLALATAAAVTTALYLQAEAQRRIAEERFEDVRRLAGFMMGDVVERLETLPGGAPLRRDVAAAGRDYVERLASTAGDDPGLQLEVAAGYGQVGRALGASSIPSLGDAKAGAAALAEAETRLRDLHRRFPERSDIAIEFARVLTWRGSMLDASANDSAGAEARHAEALRVLDAVIAREPGNIDAQHQRWSAVLGQADRWLGASRYADIIRLVGDMQQRAAGLPTPPRFAETRPIMEASLHNLMGDAHYFTGDVPRALADYQAAVRVLEARRAAGPPDARLIDRLIWSYFNVSSTLSTHGRAAEALDWAQRGSALAASLLVFDQSARSLKMAEIIRLQEAVSLSELGRHTEAITLAKTGVEARRMQAVSAPADYERQRAYAASLRPLGEIYARSGRKGEACAAYAAAAEAWRRLATLGGIGPSDTGGEARLVAELMAAC